MHTNDQSSRSRLSITKSTKYRPPRWSHQRELEAAKGRTVVIAFTTQVTKEYKLIEADAFTLKVESSNGVLLTVFKHAIITYAFKD